jgi:non-ribosomal peptide synthetase component F
VLVYPLTCLKKKWNIVAMLGVLKAGGAFVPLDPSHPGPRLQALVQSINATILLCSPQHAAYLATVAHSILALDENMIERLSTNLNEACLDARVGSNNAAYLIFTSGSTGQPKVCISFHFPFSDFSSLNGRKAHNVDLQSSHVIISGYYG